MGLYIGDKQVDMFSLLHRKNYVHAVTRLPSIQQLSQKDIGTAYCLTESYDSYYAGHIYKVTADESNFSYVDLNEHGGGISAFYDSASGGIVV